MISSRLPGDIFTRIQQICSFVDIYRAGSLTPGITLILFTQAIAQLKDIYRGFIAPISINLGLLQDVFTGTLWSTRILSQPENFQETLLISSRFPGFSRASDSCLMPDYVHVIDFRIIIIIISRREKLIQ